MNDIEEFEESVRRMLQRRAGDIGHLGLSDVTVSDQTSKEVSPGRYRWLAMAAAVLVALGGVGLLMAAQRSSGQTETVAPVESSTTTAPTVVADEEPVPEPMPTLDDITSRLPAAVNLTTGAPLAINEGDSDPIQAATQYLSARLPLEPTVVLVETVGTLTLARWSVETDAAGFVVVRNNGNWAQVVAVLADTLDVEAERDPNTLRLIAGQATDDLLAVDVLTLTGDVVSTASDPDGFNDGDGLLFGTAGIAQTSSAEIDLPLEPVSVVVRVASVIEVANVGSRVQTFSEFVLDPVGFTAVCGSEPPLTVDVGTLLDPLTDGPTPFNERPLLENQSAWHYPGDRASIEIRWPADPYLAGQVEWDEVIQDGGRPTAAWQPVEIGEAQVITLIAPADGDPCSMVEFLIFGDTAAVDWWSTAISGELTFGMPLTIAELDPDVGPEGIDGNDGEPMPLVLSAEPETTPPEVPQTGSCDGLPDAGPETGVGNGSTHASAEDALADFVTRPLDNGLSPPDAGYVGYGDPDGDMIVYAVEGHSEGTALTAVTIIKSGDLWTVETWSAAAC